MKRRFPLVLRITLSMSAVVFFLLAAIMLLIASSARASIRATVLADNDQIAEARSAELGRMLDGFRLQLVAFSLSEELRSNDRKKVGAYIAGLAGYIPKEAVGAYFAWPDGQIITNAGATSNIADRDYFKSIMSGAETFTISSPVISRTLNVPLVVMIQAVGSGPGGKPIGFVAYQLELSTLSTITSAIKVGKTGYGWMVDSAGLVIAHQDPKAVMSLNILESDKLGYKGLADFGKRMLTTDAGLGEWTRPDGVRCTTYFETIKDSPGWKLGISQPTSEITATADSLFALLAMIFCASAALAVGASLLLSRSIIAPIRSAAMSFRELAEGEADLTVRVDVRRNDELGDLVGDFNDFLGKLREIISSMKDAQGTLSTIGNGLGRSAGGAEGAVSQLFANIEAVRERSQHQASSVEESSSAVAQIARNIASLDDLIVNQAASITEASAAIEQMVGNIGAVTSSVGKMASEFSALTGASESGKATLAKAAERIAQISEQSRSLLEANEVIASIASNTNLLAMNAAIEAAHAGEAGKGFSVVADEIRRLSETATDQSRTIGDELTIVQDAIGYFVVSSKESEDAFTLVADKISSTDSLVKELGRAMSEQEEGSQQILEALREMNEVTSQVRTGSSEMSAGNTAVLDEMMRLRDAAFDVKARLDAMAASAEDIGSNVKTVASMAKDTRETIGSMESVIGRFKV
jgi:methyl-accepting chemotaxis protein